MHVSSTGFCAQGFVIAGLTLRTRTSLTSIEIPGNNNSRKQRFQET
jgi:hypothetical protein